MTNYLLAVLKGAVYSLFGKITIQNNKSLFTCSFMLVVLNMTYAQTYSLSGIIKGNKNQPISGVTIKVERQTVFTDNSGFFKINNIKNKTRSEEHTSELQSRENLVCRLLLEK